MRRDVLIVKMQRKGIKKAENHTPSVFFALGCFQEALLQPNLKRKHESSLIF